MSKAKIVRISTIKPTIFVVKDGKALLQAVDMGVESRKQFAETSLEVHIGSRRRFMNLGPIRPGRTDLRIYVPEATGTTNAEFILRVNGEVVDRVKRAWKAQKHWELYLAHYSHHDLGYTDLPANVLQEYEGFYDDIIDFCEKTDDWPDECRFRYVVEESWSVEHFIAHRPAQVVDRLLKYIREGRIEVAALFGNETTELCGHEELIRAMYSSFNLKRKYGIKISSAVLNDIPGVSWGLATVLPAAGVNFFSVGLPAWYYGQGERRVHPFWDERRVLPLEIPGGFRWKGPSGREVLFWYNGHGRRELNLWNYEHALEEITQAVTLLENHNYPFDSMLYTVRGGRRDNAPPSLNLSRVVKEWNEKWAYPKLRLATYSDFAEQLKNHKNELPVFRGELPNTDYTVGAICTAKETAVNRNTHDQLNSAERFATVASVTSDYDYPSRTIGDAYVNSLYYDLHCHGMADPVGIAQEACLSEKKGFAYRASALAHDVLLKSLNRMVDEIGLEDEGCHTVVFNPLSRKRTDLVRLPFSTSSPCSMPMHRKCHGGVPIMDSGNVLGRNIINPPIGFTKEPFDLIDLETGKKVPYQIVRLKGPMAPVPHAASRYAMGQLESARLFEIVFVAENVPGVGYKTYRLVPAAKTAPSSSELKVGKNTLENRYFRIILNQKTGTVESIYDKQLACELVDRNASHQLNQLIVRSAKTGSEESPDKATINKGEAGPVYASFVVSTEGIGCPQVTQEIILYQRIRRVDIVNRILKDATPLLESYFTFPFAIENPRFQFEGSNSVIEPLEDQLPGSNSDYYAMQHWADVSGKDVGLTLASIDAPVMEFGGLWPGYVSYAHHGVTPPGFGHEFRKPGQLTKGHMYSYIMNNNFRTNFENVQVSDVLFRYSFTSHRGDWRQAKAYDFGWAISNQLIPVCMNGKKEGTLKKSMNFCQIQQPNVLLLALKQAEDEDGFIVRFIEMEGEDTELSVKLPFVTIERAYQTNLVEENERLLSARKHEVTVPIKGFGIATIRVR